MRKKNILFSSSNYPFFAGPAADCGGPLPTRVAAADLMTFSTTSEGANLFNTTTFFVFFVGEKE